MSGFPFGVTVTVVRRTPGGLDENGDPAAGTVTSASVDGCGVDDRFSTEPDERGRTGVIVGKTLLAPAGTDIGFDDEVVIDGVTYYVDGEPGVPVNPFSGWAPGVQVALRRAAG